MGRSVVRAWLVIGGMAVLALVSSGCILAEKDEGKLTNGKEEPFAYDPFFDGESPQKTKKGELPLVPITTRHGTAGPEGYPKEVPSFGSDGRSVMTFFVTSVGGGGNLGGLGGADARCQALAGGSGSGDHGWRAYLSAEGVNAKDRIGEGPWVNHAGVMVAASVAALHDGGLSGGDLLDERGNPIPEGGGSILTGTQADGTVAGDETCRDWTSEGPDDLARIGTVGEGWNDASTSGCSGEGRVYCFAMD